MTMPSTTLFAADAASPVILHVPHASRHIPAEDRADFLIEGPALERELDESVDTATDLIARLAREQATPRPAMVINQLSRLVVDPERFPDDTEAMNAHGRGALYTRTCDGAPLRDLSADRSDELLTRYFRPYAQQLTDLVDQRLSATGRAVVIDVHSYPAQPSSFETHGLARPAICLGVDEFHTPPELIDAARTAFATFDDITLNAPYAGCYVPLKQYRTNPSVTAIMIEIRRDVYLDLQLRPDDDAMARLGAALADLCKNPLA